MAVPLHVGKGHNRDKASDMQAVSARIEADVAHGGFRQILPEFLLVSRLGYKPALREDIEDVCHLHESPFPQSILRIPQPWFPE
jgi:hypothetical protein